jgi:hypothetical protein
MDKGVSDLDNVDYFKRDFQEKIASEDTFN